MEKNGRDDLSSFWDLEALIPKKKQAPPPPHRDIAAVDVFSEAEQNTPRAADAGTDDGRIPKRSPDPKPGKADPETVFEPEDGLIRRVEIYPVPSGYPVYEQFRRDAQKLYHIKGLPCPKEPFFSFVPQYSQLTRAQLNTYFYWREEVRTGRYPTVDFSYLKLYLYELINLSDTIPPEEFFRRMTEVYLAYREVFSQLDSMIPEWLADFCLLYGFLPPEGLAPILPVLLRVCSVKEVFIRQKPAGTPADARVLLDFCSAYDYRESRYAEGKLLALMEEHIPAALSEVIRSGVSGVLVTGPVRMTVERQTFTRAICVQSLKKRLRVTYDALSHSFEMKALIGEIAKYSENRLRAAAGVKSRLTARSLPDEVKQVIDRYFDEKFPRKTRVTQATADAETESYWSYYDAEKTPLSPELAEQIEKESWLTTEKLVETFAEPESAAPGVNPIREPVNNSAESGTGPVAQLLIPVPRNAAAAAEPISASSAVPSATDFARDLTDMPHVVPVPGSPDTSGTISVPASHMPPDSAAPASGMQGSVKGENSTGGSEVCPFSPAELAALADTLAGHVLTEQSFHTGEPLDAFVDRINEKAADIFGDILLEESDGGYALIPDYRTLTKELIEQYGKSE